ncbi:asparaginase [Bacillus cereus]|uniref:asparaginase n=1 Tax=Bacillus cereus TaxID=1396 RepID=UPI0024058B6F|nr:asparaginase [Bacillus cereus]MDF9504267.1 asparaginase [Bacillus cereus]MDF9597215.1 asparaginase [Bacillus cereus]MDF9609041.1 asparaginase [Bacillus cereus]MDF9660255.1 asparaginase [Bacillus cereus]
MKKILLLATGGTIASVEGNEGLVPGLSAEELLHYFPKSSLNIEIDCKILMNIDSTNMQPEHWIEMANAVFNHYDKYDGFVITHGTDTLAYTSAALSYMLQGLSKPVVLTGSQVPISFKKTDAKKNVADALRFSCEDIGGVFIVFDGRVIIGTRAVKMRTKSYDAFESVNSPYVAEVSEHEVKYHCKPVSSSNKLSVSTNLCTDVFLLKLFPGTKPEIFNCLKGLYKGIIIESFGNGGLPFEERNLLSKIQELTEEGIAIVITTQCLEEGEDILLYEVGRKVAQHQVILSGDMNTEAIMAKLMWALGQTDKLEEIKEIIESPLASDLTIPSDKEM